jgi:uncharacterized membrane protein YeaQ/YmgE (transglycosylase-associated protein family)
VGIEPTAASVSLQPDGFEGRAGHQARIASGTSIPYPGAAHAEGCRFWPTEEVHMGLIVIVLIGGIVGWLASILMKTNAQMGIVANVVVGVVGSVLGSWVAGLLGLGAYGIVSWLVSLVGAMLLIGILKVLNVFK